MSDNFNLEEILKKFKEIGSDSAAIKAESATLKAENQKLYKENQEFREICSIMPSKSLKKLDKIEFLEAKNQKILGENQKLIEENKNLKKDFKPLEKLKKELLEMQQLNKYLSDKLQLRNNRLEKIHEILNCKKILDFDDTDYDLDIEEGNVCGGCGKRSCLEPDNPDDD